MWLRANLKVLRAGFALAGVVLVLCGSFSGAGADIVRLAGGYNGTGKAAAMAMVLDQDEDRIYGRIVDGKNNIFQLSGRVNGRAVQGTLYNSAISANFQIELKPSGLKFVIIPLVDGKPSLGAMKQIAFERGWVTHPALADYRAPAPRQGEMINLLAFLENYRGWDKAELVVAFKGLPERERAQIRLYDHLQADIMNRLCRGGAEATEIASIAKGERLDCPGLIARFDAADEMGVLRTFHDRAEIQRAALYTRVACERNVYAPARCLDEHRARPAPWRDAESILTDLQEARAPRIGPIPASTPPRLALPSFPPASENRAARTLPIPSPQKALRPVGAANPPAAVSQSRPGGSGFVAFFQARPESERALAAAEAESDDLLASLDLKLKPSTAKAESKRLTPKPARTENILDRVRQKMRARPAAPPKDLDTKAKSEASSGAVRVPTPRPRPAT